MLVNDFDDEHTLEEEEAMESADSVTNELDDLQRVCTNLIVLKNQCILIIICLKVTLHHMLHHFCTNNYKHCQLQ